MPRIYDTVLITSEKDLPLLEARMLELADLDVVHVICECRAAYDGTPKDVHFIANRDRFPQGRWNHILIEADELPQDREPAERKDILRESLFLGITGNPGDIVLHGNVDEIPPAEAVAALTSGTPATVFRMRLCAYAPGYVHPDPWLGTAAIVRGKLNSLTGLRKTRHILPVTDGGTRLAMMGEGNGDTYPDGKKLERREIDQTYPRYVRECRYPPAWSR